MSVRTLRQAVADAIKAAMPSLKACATHPGRFDAGELARLATRSPAIFVAVLGITDQSVQHDEVTGTLTFGAYALAGDSHVADRDAAALAMVDALALLVPGNRWGLAESVSNPERVRSENLYSGQVDRIGVSLWAVTWQQRMVIGQTMDAAALAALDLFATCDLQYPISDDAPVAEDAVQLPQED